MQLSHADKQRNLLQFNKLACKVLREYARDCYKVDGRRARNEIAISALSEREKDQLVVSDQYFNADVVFDVFGLPVVVQNGTLAEALSQMPEYRRNIILLSFFLDRSDESISKELNVPRTTINYQKFATLRALRKLLEEE